jgi:site-specific DNA recombinase
MSRFEKQQSSNGLATVKRVALYLRVSTGRQAENDVSLPSQRDMTTRYCKAQGWEIVTEFVEPGASATDDKRPVFQKMLEQAASPERTFDVICVHSFSRFYRNGAEMELTIRKLRKHGVDVVSMTQPTGDDPSQQLMRQIIGIFDEYTSRENGKNVTRAMRESAKQGFWNGATPPLGYKVIEAERRGSKIKKKLDVDPVEAELVRLIFELYTEGDQRTGPLGIKETTKWLNERGYRTRRGSTFGIGPVHVILKNACYSTGKWPYGRRNSRTGNLHDPSTIVEIDVPQIISTETFDMAQAKLARNNPKVTAPRIVNGPTLLTGLAVCASCGSGMTRTGTARGHRSYSYYTCAGCHQKGKSVCKGRHIPMGKLDTLIIEGVKSQLFEPDRMATILGALLDRQTTKDAAVEERRVALKSEIKEKDEKLNRLYRAIEDGIVETDDQLRDRIKTLKNERDMAQASLERIVEQSRDRSALTPERIQAFTKLMHDKLDNGDVQARKAYLRAVISEIRVDDNKVSIIGDKAALSAVIAGQNGANANVSGFVRKWRARNDSNVRPSDS